MKKILIITLLAITPMFAFSQMYVKGPNGDVGVGTDTPTEKLDIDGTAKAKAVILENTFSASASCERIGFSAFAFGAGVNAGFAVDENYHLEFRSNNRANVLDRKISIGNLLLRFQKNTGYAGFGVNPATALHVNGSITYNGTLNNASDRRLKTNINDFKYGLDEVLQLRPVNFRYNGKAGFKNAGQDQVGLVAQDLQKVAPELVSTFTHEEENEEAKVISSEDYLMISESSIKYMLINAVKEQQDKIETLEQELAEMKEMMRTVLNNSNTINTQSIDLDGRGAYLEQNQPNPFNSNTLIKYSVPTDVTNAVVNIFDAKGQLIHSERIAQMGAGQIQIKAGTIAAGTYSYSLVVNGKVLDTKRMVIAK